MKRDERFFGNSAIETKWLRSEHYKNYEFMVGKTYHSYGNYTDFTGYVVNIVGNNNNYKTLRIDTEIAESKQEAFDVAKAYLDKRGFDEVEDLVDIDEMS